MSSAEKGPVTPNLDAVFKKWEKKAAGQENCDGASQITERILREGKQRWKDKYGETIQPNQHRPARRSARRDRVMALPKEEVIQYLAKKIYEEMIFKRRIFVLEFFI